MPNSELPYGIQKLPIEQGLDIIKISFSMLKKNYGLLLGTSIILVFLVTLSSALPIIGTIVSCFFGPLVTIGLFILYEEIYSTGSSEFRRLFIAFENQEILKKIFPLILVNLIISFTIIYFSGVTKIGSETQVGDSYFNIIMIFIFVALQLIWTMMSYFALPLIALNDLKVLDALRASILGSFVNMLPLIVFGVATFIIAAACIVFLIFPVIFLATPLSLIGYYLAYRSIFIHPQLKPYDNAEANQIEIA